MSTASDVGFKSVQRWSDYHWCPRGGSRSSKLGTLSRRARRMFSSEHVGSPLILSLLMTTANSEHQFLLSICKDSKNVKFAGFFVMSLVMMRALYVLEAKEVQNDILQETWAYLLLTFSPHTECLSRFIDTTAGWINLLLLSSSGRACKDSSRRLVCFLTLHLRNLLIMYCQCNRSSISQNYLWHYPLWQAARPRS